MKRTKAVAATIVVATLCALIFISCGKEQSNELSAPQNLQVTAADILEWDKVDNATEYLVDINGEEYRTDTNSLDIFLLTDKVGEYKISVTACDGTGKYVLSEQSEIKYNVVEPEGLGVKPTGTGNEYELKVIKPELISGKVIIPSETKDGNPITELGNGALENCAKITSVVIPDSIKRLGPRAFSSCDSLTRVRLSDSIENLGDFVFINCKSLLEINIPKSVVKSIGRQVQGCDSLVKFTVDDGNPVYKSEGNCIIRRADNVLVQGCGASVIPDYVTAIDKKAFEFCTGLRKIAIPKNVQSIGINAFYNCTNLTEVNISGSVQTIGRYAFYKCANLTEVDIPVGVQTIGNYSFYGTGLTDISIPQSVNTIDSKAFYGCDKLKSIKVDANNPIYKDDGNCLMRKSDSQVVWGCETSVIPSYAKSIGDYAFSRIAVSDFIVPEGVEEIGEGAFASPTLQHIKLPSTLKAIGYSAFSGCAKLEEISLPKGLLSIGDYAFFKCQSLTELILPDGLLSIGEYAFDYCDNIQTVILPASVKTIGEAAFTHPTVYTAVAFPFPDGWYKRDFTNLDSWYASMKGEMTHYGSTVITGCELSKEDGIEYVKSFTYIKHRIINLEGDEVGTFIEPWGTKMFTPSRKGYTFMGWATEEDSDVVVYPNTEHTDSNGNTYYTTLTKEQRDTIPSGTTLYTVWQKQE